MKTLSIFTTLIGLLLVTQISNASSITGNFTPTYQYFKVTYPNTVTNIFPYIISNFLLKDTSSIFFSPKTSWL